MSEQPSSLSRKYWPVLYATQEYGIHMRLPKDGERLPDEIWGISSPPPEVLAYVIVSKTMSKTGDMFFTECCLVSNGQDVYFAPYESTEMRKKEVSFKPRMSAGTELADPEKVMAQYNNSEIEPEENKAEPEQKKKKWTRVVCTRPVKLIREDGKHILPNRLVNGARETALDIANSCTDQCLERYSVMAEHAELRGIKHPSDSLNKRENDGNNNIFLDTNGFKPREFKKNRRKDLYMRRGQNALLSHIEDSLEGLSAVQPVIRR